MNIVPDSIVVASEEFFSFVVHEEELLDAIDMRVVPADFPVESLRGLKILEYRTTRKSKDYFRVMFRHAPNPKSPVKLEGK